MVEVEDQTGLFRRKSYLQQRSESDRQKKQTEQILEKNVAKVGRLKYHIPQWEQIISDQWEEDNSRLRNFI